MNHGIISSEKNPGERLWNFAYAVSGEVAVIALRDLADSGDAVWSDTIVDGRAAPIVVEQRAYARYRPEYPVQLDAMIHMMHRHGGVVLPLDTSDEDIKQTFGSMQSLSEQIMRHIDERMGRSYQLQQIVQLVDLKSDWACFVGALHEDPSTVLLLKDRMGIELFEAIEPGSEGLYVKSRW